MHNSPAILSQPGIEAAIREGEIIDCEMPFERSPVVDCSYIMSEFLGSRESALLKCWHDGIPRQCVVPCA